MKEYHFKLLNILILVVLCAQSCLTLCNPMDCTLPGSSVHGILQNTGVGSLSLLQGIFSTQGLNPGLLHYRWILYQLSHKGNPRVLEWVAYPFSSRSSRPRNRMGSPAFQVDSLPTELSGKPSVQFPTEKHGTYLKPLHLSMKLHIFPIDHRHLVVVQLLSHV